MTNFIHENPLGDIELNTVTENGKRCYVTPTGEKYPSVTTVLSNYKKDGIVYLLDCYIREIQNYRVVSEKWLARQKDYLSEL